MTTRKYLSFALLAVLAGSFSGCKWSGFGWGGSKASTANNPMVTSIGQPPQKPSVASSLADAFTIKPKVTPAEDPLNVNGKQGPIGADVYLSAARLYENRGEFEAASGQYRKALEVAPKSLPALVGYARLQDRQNKFDEATKLYKKALVAHPQSATAYNDLGLCQARHGQSELALESLQKAVQIEPTNKLYRNNVSAVLVDMGRSREAFEHLVLAHGEAVAHYNLGFMHFQRDKSELASQQFALAVEKDPSLVQARDMLMRTGGMASHEIVQKTQHVAEGRASTGAPGKRAAAPLPASPAFGTPPAASKAAPEPSYIPRQMPVAKVPATPQRQAAIHEPVSLAPITVKKRPVQSFPPVRLPDVAQRREDEQAESAPLPDDPVPGVSGRSSSEPRKADGEE